MRTLLRRDSGFERPDDLYAALVDAHLGLSDAQSQVLNAKLVLLLANHIADADVMREAIATAKQEL